MLVPAQAAGTQDLATLYGFRDDDMAHAIERCAVMPEAEAVALGAAARAWYEAERAAFPARLRAALDAA